jgi:hypothetical protein
MGGRAIGLERGQITANLTMSLSAQGEETFFRSFVRSRLLVRQRWSN